MRAVWIPEARAAGPRRPAGPGSNRTEQHRPVPEHPRSIRDGRLASARPRLRTAAVVRRRGTCVTFYKLRVTPPGSGESTVIRVGPDAFANVTTCSGGLVVM